MKPKELLRMIRETLREMRLIDVVNASSGHGTSVWAMRPKRDKPMDSSDQLPDTNLHSKKRQEWLEDFSEG